MSDRDKCPACNDFCQLWVGGECVGKDEYGEIHHYTTPTMSHRCRPQVDSCVALRPLCEACGDVSRRLEKLVAVFGQIEAINVRLGSIEDMQREQGGE